MRFASLGSGSEGNALIVEVAKTRLMIDCGFGLAETGRRLERLGLAAEDITAVLITHEHSDHIGGAARFVRKYDIPIWASRGTLPWLKQVQNESINVIDSHMGFEIDDIFVQPFPVPHDAREPVQFTFWDGQRRLGLLTDVGSVTPYIEECLNDVDGLVLECNYDLDMLMDGPYPFSLKQRVSGRFGHLDNHSAAKLLTKINAAKLQHVIAAHLSQQNNCPNLVKEILGTTLNCQGDWISIANQVDGFGWRQLA